jgi:TPR repeat protein
MKTSTALSLLTLTLACLCASATADNSAYNKGVNAWRAKDYAEARKQWTQSISEGGPDEALNNLAYLLYNGLGGDPMPEKAVELWRKGAALSVSEAQWHLGQAYEEGRGVQSNQVQAYAWYLCAAATASNLSKNDETEREIEIDAKESAQKISEKLNVSQQAQAKAIAQQLIAKYATRLSTDKP